MRKATRKRGDQALASALRTLDAARALIARRLEYVDLEDARQRGLRLAGTMRTDLDRRLRPAHEPHPL